jgi:peptide/nickel transport system substrate-binding protein
LVIPEEIVALGALEKGDLDMSKVSQLGSYERAKTIKNVYLGESKGYVWQYIYYINHKMKPMDDIRVRRALAYALDVKGIASRIGKMVVAFPSPLAPAVFGATDKFWEYEYNIDKAKQLLAEAGYPEGFELRLIYLKNVLYEPIALEVKNSWDKVIDVKLDLLEKGVWTKTMKEYNHHIAAWGLARTAPFLYAQGYQTGAPQNYSQYSNPKVDEAIKNAKTGATKDEARKYWHEFQKLATQDVATYIAAVGGNIYAISNKLHNLTLYPYTGLVDLEKAYVK